MIETLFTGIDHAEGIAWSPLGYAICGTESGEILRLDTQKKTTDVLATVGEDLLGVAVDSYGRCYVCDPSAGLVWSVDPQSGAVEPLVPPGTFRVPNACVVLPGGSILVTDSGSCWDGADGTISLIDQEGSVSTLASGLAFPNGLDLEDTSLYVVETSPPALTRYAITSNGGLSEREIVALLPNAVPDGVHVAQRVAYVTYYRPDRIVAVENGNVSVIADDPQGRLLQGPSNCCFEPGTNRLLVANLAGKSIASVTVEANL